MKTKQQLIEDVCILICKHNDLVNEIIPIAQKDNKKFEELKELSLSRYLSIFPTSKKTYIEGCGELILNKINRLKQIKDNINSN